MIKLADISKYYRSNNNVALGLHKVNLEFEIGDFVVITGESGSGKSTLLNIISGSDTYDDGELYFEGRETSYFDETDWENYRREKIGFIYQNYNLIDSFSVIDNVKTAIFIIHPDMEEEQAERKALRYLKSVGLEEQTQKKAARLSSGQKQRLAIARALAKETDVIVADEPTGNLDMENSIQIIKILSELSRDRLVLMVTHNYDEAEQYATRKIRMYNGEAEEDIRLKPNQYTGERKEYSSDEPLAEKDREKPKQENHLAKKMIKKVRRGKPHNTVILFLLFLFLFGSIYIFYGSLKKNLDYSATKDYSYRTYINNDMTRLCVKNPDGSAMTSEDSDIIQSLKHVEYVDLYDTVNDITYVSEEGNDYIFEFQGQAEVLAVLDDSKTIKSVSGIKDRDIKSGTMPEKTNEILVASSDESLVGQSGTIYLRRKYNWEKNYIKIDFLITGITDRGNEEQIYISQTLAQRLGAMVRRLEDYSFYGVYEGEGYGLSRKEWALPEMSEEMLGELNKETQNNPIFFLNEGLSGNEILVSEGFYQNAYITDVIDISQELYKTSYLFYGPSYDRQGMELQIQEGSTEQGPAVIEVSREIFDSIYTDQESYQISVYITDYAYTDRVLAELEKAGYEAVSVFRAGSTDYNVDKTNEQTMLLAVSLAALIMVFFIGIFLIRLLINGRKKDYSIMILMGMGRSVIDRMNLLDILYHGAAALSGTIAIVNLAMFCEVPYMASAVRYYELADYLIFVVIICVMMAVLYRSLRLVKRKSGRDI